jgi:hydrogenase maturation protein HypF
VNLIARDLHPDYLSSTYANDARAAVVTVQHHYAHVLSCMADNEIDGRCLGVSWDGTGFGLDGTVWGGEFLHVGAHSFKRVAHLRSFGLPGGEQAVKEPRRSAVGALFEIFGEMLFQRDDLWSAFSVGEHQVLESILTHRVNCPMTSSAGRLFDAVASLLGLRHTVRFEGQAAMELEFAIDGIDREDRYELPVAPGRSADDPLILDWAPMVQEMLAQRGESRAKISAMFHNALAHGIVEVARRVEEERVVLSGGCFQNRYLCELAVRLLRQAGFRPYWHQRVPPNDGGISLGQLVAVSRADR